jgi:hypothetical protein
VGQWQAILFDDHILTIVVFWPFVPFPAHTVNNIVSSHTCWVKQIICSPTTIYDFWIQLWFGFCQIGSSYEPNLLIAFGNKHIIIFLKTWANHYTQLTS